MHLPRPKKWINSNPPTKQKRYIHPLCLPNWKKINSDVSYYCKNNKGDLSRMDCVGMTSNVAQSAYNDIEACLTARKRVFDCVHPKHHDVGHIIARDFLKFRLKNCKDAVNTPYSIPRHISYEQFSLFQNNAQSNKKIDILYDTLEMNLFQTEKQLKTLLKTEAHPNPWTVNFMEQRIVDLNNILDRLWENIQLVYSYTQKNNIKRKNMEKTETETFNIQQPKNINSFQENVKAPIFSRKPYIGKGRMPKPMYDIYRSLIFMTLVDYNSPMTSDAITQDINQKYGQWMEWNITIAFVNHMLYQQLRPMQLVGCVWIQPKQRAWVVSSSQTQPMPPGLTLMPQNAMFHQ